MPAACTCGSDACAKRAARGLAPFCQMPRPASRERPANEFSSYGAAADHRRAMPAAIRDRYHIRSTRVSGGPPRFVVELK